MKCVSRETTYLKKQRPMAIQVAVADDHHLLRKGIIAELSKYNDIAINGEAADGDAAITLLKTAPPHILLLDLNMPKLSGMEVLQLIQKESIAVKIAVLSMHDEDSTVIECIEAGAHGFVSKNEEPDEVYMAIKSIAQNGFYFSERTNKIMLNKLLKKNLIMPVFEKTDISFTERELELIRALSHEKTTAEIAREMHYSPRTIEGMRQELIHRVGVRNAIGLILYAVRHSYI